MFRFSMSEPPRAVESSSDLLAALGKILVTEIVVSGVGGNGSVQLRDGIDTSGEVKATLYAATNTSVIDPCKGGILFERGLFLDVAATSLARVTFYVAEEVSRG